MYIQQTHDAVNKNQRNLHVGLIVPDSLDCIW